MKNKGFEMPIGSGFLAPASAPRSDSRRRWPETPHIAAASPNPLKSFGSLDSAMCGLLSCLASCPPPNGNQTVFLLPKRAISPEYRSLESSNWPKEKYVGARSEEQFTLTAHAAAALIAKHGRGIVMVISMEEYEPHSGAQIRALRWPGAEVWPLRYAQTSRYAGL